MYSSSKQITLIGITAAKYLSCPEGSNYNLTSSSLSQIHTSSNETATLFCYYDMGLTCAYNAMNGKIVSGLPENCPSTEKTGCYTTWSDLLLLLARASC